MNSDDNKGQPGEVVYDEITKKWVEILVKLYSSFQKQDEEVEGIGLTPRQIVAELEGFTPKGLEIIDSWRKLEKRDRR